MSCTVFLKHWIYRPGVQQVTIPREALLGELRGGISSPAAAQSCGKHLWNSCPQVSGDCGCSVKAVESSDTVGLTQLKRDLVDDVCDGQESACSPVVSCLGWQPEERFSRQSPCNYGAKHTLQKHKLKQN